MVEPLTDDAQLVLALIRDKPEVLKWQMSNLLGIFDERVSDALTQLSLRELIQTRSLFSSDFGRLIDNYPERRNSKIDMVLRASNAASYIAR